MYYSSVIYILESKDESQTNLIEKFEFESNQMVLELEFEFEQCDLGLGGVNQVCTSEIIGQRWFS